MLGTRMMMAASNSLLPETKALIARFTTPPTVNRAVLINNLIKSLITGGIWAKLDALYLMAAADAQAARQNWIANQYNLTAVSSPTFTADRGYQGDAASSYLDTNYNPTTAIAPTFVQNSAHLGVYSRTNNTSGLALVGANNGAATNRAQLFGRSAGNVNSAWMNQTSTATTHALTSTLGFIDLVRVNAANTQQYLNSASTGTQAVASSGVPNRSFYLLAMNNNGTAGGFGGYQLSEASIGATLSGAEISAKNAAILTYLQAVGAA